VLSCGSASGEPLAALRP